MEDQVTLREAKSVQVAIERLSEVVSGTVLCFKVKGGYEFHVVSDMTMDPMRKSKAIEALAFLADVALREKMDRDEVYERVKWTGKVPAQGLPAWMESALCWLRYGTLSHPSK